MNPPSEDVKDFLLAESSLALVFATDVFVAIMPATPDNAVAIFDTGGSDPAFHLTYGRPTAQVRVRGAKDDYRSAQWQAQETRDTLIAVTNETQNAARYIQIWAEGDVLFVEWDDNSRPVFTVNFRIHRTE